MATIAAIVAAISMIVVGGGTAVAAPQTGEMFLTFVRHGESAGNASGLVDSSVPGPHLTAKGQAQAAAVAQLLADRKFDGVYASTMIRTQETAAPTSALRHLPVVVEPGVREIEAGDYEGTPEKDALATYFQAPLQWMQRNFAPRIPGSIDGYEFMNRMNAAIKDIQNRGSKRPVVFSHGGAIMVWVMAAVSNPNLGLMKSDPLNNTGHVVVKGSPEKGWKLIEWDGKSAA
ncbi:histidine phosphatase family protein [Gordonia neofelifaecis]|uniref:Phosphoglycerate mutase family protein n=1 Tax=Gordonia neofelifaecis NRRL B-59395 TaxID=644548 RepID=F1YG12_9ACTN|nr:histidine phosphatase family protein [Gordonia neofelifaecis]EGD56589.1 phosphoglycerate mutase family protein [Gordonia neofelifaecis NRRL B-59395]